MNSVILGRVPSFCSSEMFPGDSDVAHSGTTLLSTKVWKVTNGSSGVDFFWKTGEGPARGHFSCIWKEGVHWASLEASQRRGCHLEILGVEKSRIWGNQGGRIRTVREKKKKENQNLVPLRTLIAYWGSRRRSVEFQRVTRSSRHLFWPLLLYLL